MKKIFACDRFAPDENNEYSLADVTPEEYLKTMLSCVDGGILCIAKREDAVSIEQSTLPRLLQKSSRLFRRAGRSRAKMRGKRKRLPRSRLSRRK